jgi:hypothetical protein
MRDELDALTAAIKTATGRDAHLIDVPADAGTRYTLLEPRGWARMDDIPLSGGSQSEDAPVRIKAVSTTPSGAITDLEAVRDALFLDGTTGTLTVTGHVVDVRFVRHEADYVEDLTIAATNMRLAVSVDTIRLVSVPTDDES